MNDSQTINVGLIQMSCEADKQKNFEKARHMILQAIKAGAQIICLQEMFNTVYFCHEENYDSFKLAETSDSPIWSELSEIASSHHIVLIVPYFEKRAEGIYHNSAIVINADGSILGRYRKNHIPDDPGYYEKFYFTPGDTGYKTFDTYYGKIGVLICWDQWYPEAARITSLMGADILFYPTAIGWESSEEEQTRIDQQEAWMSIQKSHAIANGIFVCAVNRVGSEALTTFWGKSFIVNPIGSVVTQATESKEEVIVYTIDRNEIDHYRTHWPFFRDRRIDTYKPLLNRFIDDP